MQCFEARFPLKKAMKRKRHPVEQIVAAQAGRNGHSGWSARLQPDRCTPDFAAGKSPFVILRRYRCSTIMLSCLISAVTSPLSSSHKTIRCSARSTSAGKETNAKAR